MRQTVAASHCTSRASVLTRWPAAIPRRIRACWTWNQGCERQRASHWRVATSSESSVNGRGLRPRMGSLLHLDGPPLPGYQLYHEFLALLRARTTRNGGITSPFIGTMVNLRTPSALISLGKYV